MAAGVFCLEGQWDEDLTDRTSVRPTLELLDRLREISFIHRGVATEGDLDYFLDRFLTMRRGADRFPVLYLAMHGSGESVHLTRKNAVSVHHITQRLAGACDGRRLYFGSCSVLDTSDGALRDMIDRTGAELICGYTADVDWTESAAFDTVLLPYLANGTLRELGNQPHWRGVADHLGFRVIYRDGRRRW